MAVARIHARHRLAGQGVLAGRRGWCKGSKKCEKYCRRPLASQRLRGTETLQRGQRCRTAQRNLAAGGVVDLASSGRSLREMCVIESNNPGGTRTRTGWILNPLPLPIGLPGRVACARTIYPICRPRDNATPRAMGRRVMPSGNAGDRENTGDSVRHRVWHRDEGRGVGCVAGEQGVVGSAGVVVERRFVRKDRRAWPGGIVGLPRGALVP